MPELSPLRILAFDYGSKRIGVAVGQSATGTATALKTVHNRPDAGHWDCISQLIKQWEPDAFVVGWPTHGDGSDHELWPQVNAFCQILSKYSQLPIHKVDEYLSSFEAESLARQNDKVSDIDSMSAQLLLESWFRQQHDNQ